MKRIRFWGTRGSLPVSLTAAGVRQKLVTALRGASGRVFNSDDEINDYLDGLGLAVAGTYGGHSPCVEIEAGGPDYVLCDLGSGLRPFGQAAIARHGPASPAHVRGERRFFLEDEAGGRGRPTELELLVGERRDVDLWRVGRLRQGGG